MGLAVARVGRLALGARYREAGNGNRLAPQPFRLFWTWKIRRGKPGRPPVPREVRDLVRRMSRENPGWGAPRIHGELLKLGINVGETSVSKYLVRNRKPPSKTWRTFLEDHIKSLVSVDFFTSRRSGFRSFTSSW